MFEITGLASILAILASGLAIAGFYIFCFIGNIKALSLRCDTNADRFHTQQREMREMRRVYERMLLNTTEIYTHRVRSLAEAMGYEEVTMPATKDSVVWKKAKKRTSHPFIG